MICSQYETLTPKEKTEMVGKLIHAVQSDSELYLLAQKIIETGEQNGLFEGVKILHPDTKTD